jgi:hypothetical protein
VTALVTVETVLLALLVLLVAGLLRSHAEILRRLGPGESPLPEPRRGSADTHAAAITGETLEGDRVKLDFAAAAGSPTLLAFLSTGCSVCHGFWEGLGEATLPSPLQTLIVTRAEDRESPARLRELAPEGVPVVMSSAAWEDYRVPGAPYFVLVDGAIRGEGAASSWEALASLLKDAMDDVAITPSSGRARGERIDERFAAAGIGPDDPSLYPRND